MWCIVSYSTSMFAIKRQRNSSVESIPLSYRRQTNDLQTGRFSPESLSFALPKAYKA